ncbi:ElyC/SanA/YdcF family protein [Plantactinospora sonchi]|uniref:ElyC/SanA/YdcF family protein n=1 Tax=Plantactinospora sonchi TaxID=1544735 RepID=A0ABU7RQX3_9ACTN
MGGVPPRVVRAEELSGFTTARLMDVTTAVMAILALPRPVGQVDAVVVPTGQGEQWRISHAIRRWEADRDIRCLLVANGNPAERTYHEVTMPYLRRLGLRRLDGVHLQAEAAPNTGLQAAWVADRVEALGVTSLAISVSAYHLPRVFLTLLRALSQRGVRVPLVPDPVPVSSGAAVPETGATGYDLLPGEVERILRYADEGWLATPEELRRYLRWWWDEHGGPLGGSATLGGAPR